MIGGKHYYIHRLVAETFIPNPEEKPEVDHIDRCPTHNNVDNLRWATHSENLRNTPQHNKISSYGGTHTYDNNAQYMRENRSHFKYVLFSDRTHHWVPNSEALELLKLPVNKRHYGNG